ncbi:MAG TPA: crosslink repair DNA glycosylase YcaQ family protein, partial [Streptosporangiaceae bacterium]
MAPQVPLASARALAMARHGLAGSGLDSALAATEAAVGIYSSAPTCYLSCAARVPGFAAADLDQELYQRRRLLRLRCMHGMAYIVSAGSLPVIAAATQARPADIERIARVAGLTAAGYAELSARAEEAVGDGSVTVPELREALGPHAP